jgi:hypothetical protein
MKNLLLLLIPALLIAGAATSQKTRKEDLEEELAKRRSWDYMNKIWKEMTGKPLDEVQNGVRVKEIIVRLNGKYSKPPRKFSPLQPPMNELEKEFAAKFEKAIKLGTNPLVQP